MRKLWTVLFVSLLAAAAGCEEQPATESTQSDQAQADQAEAQQADREAKAAPSGAAAEADEADDAQQVEEGVRLVQGLAIEGPNIASEFSDIVLSPNGAFAYATQRENGPIVIFARDPDSGRLKMSGIEADVEGLSGASEADFSHDGKKLWVFGNADENPVAVRFTVDPKTGALETDGTMPIAPGYANAVSPDGAELYTMPPTDNKLTIWQADEGKFKRLKTREVGVQGAKELGGGQHLAISPDGKHLYLTTNKQMNEAAETLAHYRLYTFARNMDSGHLDEVGFLEHEKQVDNLDRPSGVAVSPDGERVAVIRKETDGGSVTVFRRDAKTGKLAVEGSHKLPSGDFLPKKMEMRVVSPEAIDFGPDGEMLYVTAGFTPAIGVYDLRE